MAYNNRNKLLYWKQVQEETQKHFIPGITPYAPVFRQYIEPRFPMSYATFMKIINMNVDKLLKEQDEKSK